MLTKLANMSWKMTPISLQMEDNLNFLKMEDYPNFKVNGRQT